MRHIHTKWNRAVTFLAAQMLGQAAAGFRWRPHAQAQGQAERDNSFGNLGIMNKLHLTFNHRQKSSAAFV